MSQIWQGVVKILCCVWHCSLCLMSWNLASQCYDEQADKVSLNDRVTASLSEYRDGTDTRRLAVL